MNPSVSTTRIYTPEKANATLPLVKMIVGDIVELAKSIVQTRDRLDSIRKRAGKSQLGNYADELDDIETRLSEDVSRLEGFVAELHELGVEPKVLTEGLVDFPAMIDGRIVNLCWKYGEEKIEFWHTLQEGFGGRQPVSDFEFEDPESKLINPNSN